MLDLGVGTGETSRQCLEAHPAARAVCLDESRDKLDAAAKVLGARAELRLGRFQDPLPEGPFELIVSAFALHHVDAAAKADLFPRVAQRLSDGGRFVLADVVEPHAPVSEPTPLDRDRASSAARMSCWTSSVTPAFSPRSVGRARHGCHCRVGAVTVDTDERSFEWRRRESNPRPRTHRPSVYERSPGFDLARRDGSRTTTRRASHPRLSRLGRLALPRRRARSLAPRPGPRAQPGGTSPYLVETRRRVRDRSSHLRCSRLFYEADRGPRLAARPENRPRRNLIAPVCSPHG